MSLDPVQINVLKTFITAILAPCLNVKFVIGNALLDPIPNRSGFTFLKIVQIAPKYA